MIPPRAREVLEYWFGERDKAPFEWTRRLS